MIANLQSEKSFSLHSRVSHEYLLHYQDADPIEHTTGFVHVVQPISYGLLNSHHRTTPHLLHSSLRKITETSSLPYRNKASNLLDPAQKTNNHLARYKVVLNLCLQIL